MEHRARAGLALMGILMLTMLSVVWAVNITCTTACNGTESSDRITVINADATPVNALGGSDRVFIGGAVGAAAITVNLGTGNDTVFGGAGNDLLRGEAGNDQINGGGGADVIGDTDGTAGCGDGDEFGNDRIDAGTGDDATVCGGAGNDQINGGDGTDILDGNAGNDRLFGGIGNDTMRDGAGNDIIEAGPGTDVFTRGGGNDIFIFRRGDVTGAETLTAPNTCTINAGDVVRIFLVGYTLADLPANFPLNTRLTGANALNAVTDPAGGATLTITPGPGVCIISIRSR